MLWILCLSPKLLCFSVNLEGTDKNFISNVKPKGLWTNRLHILAGGHSVAVLTNSIPRGPLAAFGVTSVARQRHSDLFLFCGYECDKTRQHSTLSERHSGKSHLCVLNVFSCCLRKLWTLSLLCSQAILQRLPFYFIYRDWWSQDLRSSSKGLFKCIVFALDICSALSTVFRKF